MTDKPHKAPGALESTVGIGTQQEILDNKSAIP
jgi:hypothetical protein